MSGGFRVDAVHEVFKDPFGHFDHRTILEGVLVGGALEVGGWLAIPTATGLTVATVVIGFAPGDPAVGGARRVDAARLGTAVLGVATFRPAVPAELIAPGAVAVPVTADVALALVDGMLAAPLRSSLFHAMQIDAATLAARGRSAAEGPFPCEVCPRAVLARPGAATAIAGALDDPRPEVVASALLALGDRCHAGDLERLGTHPSVGVRAVVRRIRAAG